MPKRSQTRANSDSEPTAISHDRSANQAVRLKLAQRLKILLTDTGLSQRQAAKLLGIEQPRIAEIMALKIQYFSIETLMKYLERLGEYVVISTQRKGSESAKALELMQSWLADDSGYDEATWPELKENLEKNRLSSRKLFSD